MYTYVAECRDSPDFDYISIVPRPDYLSILSRFLTMTTITHIQIIHIKCHVPCRTARPARNRSNIKHVLKINKILKKYKIQMLFHFFFSKKVQRGQNFTTTDDKHCSDFLLPKVATLLYGMSNQSLL